MKSFFIQNGSDKDEKEFAGYCHVEKSLQKKN